MSLDDTSPVQEGSTQPRASLRSVFGVLFGFAVLLACLGNLLGYGPRSTAASPALAKSYELASMPFELSLQEPLHLLPSGEAVYVFTSPRAVKPVEEEAAKVTSTDSADQQEAEPAAKPESESSTLAESGAGAEQEEESALPEEAEAADDVAEEEEEVDWTLAEPTIQGGPPSQLFLVNYPWKNANAVIGSQFQNVQWRELKDIEAKGGRTAVDGGKLTWNGYAADFVLEREYRSGLRFQDRIRVNLTMNGECWIAYGIWPEQEAGSKKTMSDALAALIPHEPEPESSEE